MNNDYNHSGIPIDENRFAIVDNGTGKVDIFIMKDDIGQFEYSKTFWFSRYRTNYAVVSDSQKGHIYAIGGTYANDNLYGYEHVGEVDVMDITDGTIEQYPSMNRIRGSDTIALFCRAVVMGRQIYVFGRDENEQAVAELFHMDTKVWIVLPPSAINSQAVSFISVMKHGNIYDNSSNDATSKMVLYSVPELHGFKHFPVRIFDHDSMSWIIGPNMPDAKFGTIALRVNRFILVKHLCNDDLWALDTRNHSWRKLEGVKAVFPQKDYVIVPMHDRWLVVVNYDGIVTTTSQSVIDCINMIPLTSWDLTIGSIVLLRRLVKEDRALLKEEARDNCSRSHLAIQQLVQKETLIPEDLFQLILSYICQFGCN
mmetsp:Transcript_48999/g.59100  ORF Transcript_48999/g.59100 Transcript_48999/m.59100 type:complete len:369 (-) Transcript_48999:54-1160(-)